MKTTKKGLEMKFIVALVFGMVVVSCASGPKTDTEESISYDASTLQNVVRITNDRFRKQALAVSPDGGKLLYCESEETDVNEFLPYNAWKIILLRNSSSPAKTPLINDASFAPTWFEDNASFAYVVYESDSSKLIKSNISGGGKTYITRSTVGNGDANPNIKENKILCDTGMKSGGNVIKRQLVSLLDNGNEITILGEGYQPSWHPDGKKFVFIRNDADGKGASIYEMDIATTQVTQIYAAVPLDKEGNKEFCSSPSYSKDGTQILFAKGTDVQLTITVEKTEKGGISGFVGSMFQKKSKSESKAEITRTHIFAMKSDGTNVTQLTNGNVSVFSPVWGINNDIYFISTALGGFTEIWKAHLNL